MLEFGDMLMRRLRLKADGRIVELRDGNEAPLVPTLPPGTDAAAPVLDVRALRNRSQLTQVQFAARLGVPLETIRNWEQGKREPRGPARALLTLIARAPDLTFALLAKASSAH
jgi:putative transcriptional regulator